MEFAVSDIHGLIKKHYGLDVEARLLNGYDEMNYLLTDKQRKKYILKVANDDQGVQMVNAQVRMINHLASSSLAGRFQKVLKNQEGSFLTVVPNGERNWYLRVLSFLEGTFWYESESFTPELFENLGKFLGQMDRALADFSEPALHRSLVWDISNARDAIRKLKYIQDPAKRRMADYFLLQFEMEVLPQLASLRRACIHNDAHDYNLLVQGNAITGLIDFGDAVYTALINNLAIACTYGAMYVDDPLPHIAKIIQGYHGQYALQQEETDLLYYLIAARLCISVTQSAYNAHLKSENAHQFLSEKMAWELLEKWIRINPLKAISLFRQSIGKPALIAQEPQEPHLLKERREYIGRNLSISYRHHLTIVKGALQYLYDDRGNTYVDCVNNVSHVGHCHPTVVRAMQKQIATLNTNTRYLHDAIVDYAEMLTATLPPKLKVCYFVNSGSEANDLAIRMARHFTGRNDVIVLDHAYHGTTTLAIEMSPYKFDSKGGSGQRPYIHKALSPDLYRGKYQYGDKEAGAKYALSVWEILTELKQNNTPAAAFICETLLGVGGQIPLPEGYLKDVYRYVRSFGGICIADEVQVGFGRVGEKFWGFELQNAEPDIVVMGKPIGNGHPLAAVVVTEEIANAFDNGLEYFNTYGGNPVSMATGIAVLNVIRDEALQKNALETGNYLMDLLQGLMDKFPVISDVRGYGLFIGAEMVRDRTTKEPFVPEIDDVIERMKDRGFLLSTDGPLHNVLKIKPPVVFSKENARDMVRNLEQVMAEL